MSLDPSYGKLERLIVTDLYNEMAAKGYFPSGVK